MGRWAKQMELQFHRRGGARKGAGRKPKGARAGVSHHGRERIRAKTVLHATLKMLPHVWNLRGARAYTVVAGALEQGAEREGFRITQFSAMRDHVHLIVEADSNEALSAGMKGVAVRIARALNRIMRRKGRILRDRYHSRALKSLREIRNALAYVLNNLRKHSASIGQTFAKNWIDPMSSAASFDGWSISVKLHPSARPPPTLAHPTNWTLRIGWREKYGPIHPAFVPSA
jgi:REP element-mobilizing transposase RayT